MEQEEDLKDNISENWPEHGDISVKDLRIRYAPDLPNVLHGVTFRVKDGEKVAIVGRTGAGKSSISSALFRMVPIVGGAIFIDDVDISQVALSKLRSKITIIPQDPVLFSGTLRSNLDPTESFEDAVIWDTLKRVHFLDTAMIPANSSESLNTDVAYSVSLDMNLSSNGDNFSLGQKQLLCLARSLLQGNKIIVLDEATASVDGATDSKIQETIRTEFTAKTVICVAHRLRTIIDYDKILVLDKGCVKEFGSPAELMRDSNSLFTTMCKESGEYDVLLSMAKKVTS